MNPYKVFHSPCEFLRNQIHLVLVRPEEPGNLGAALRARANMGIRGHVFVVGQNEAFLTGEAEKFAMHAKADLAGVQLCEDLGSALARVPRRLTLAATARIGSSKRPHPLWVDSAMERAVARLRDQSCQNLVLVFGSEGSGLDNSDLALCDWVVTIPSVEHYRSLNLAQAILVFLYETNRQLLARPAEFSAPKIGQRDRLIAHLLQIAEDCGFVLPADPHKMRAKLETILSSLPPHVPEAQTLHGLMDQISRNLNREDIQYKGRYKREVELANNTYNEGCMMPEDEKSQETLVDQNAEPADKAAPKEAATAPEPATEGGGSALAEELLYLRAEFENYKKRMEREQDRAIRFSNEKIIGELLFVIDLFERALAHGAALKDGNKDVKTFAEGVEMTHRELLQILSRFGVEMIGTEGDAFNPAWHEAISQQATSEDKANKVLSVVQKGCRLHGRLLKPAKVIVGKADPNFEEKE